MARTDGLASAETSQKTHNRSTGVRILITFVTRSPSCVTLLWKNCLSTWGQSLFTHSLSSCPPLHGCQVQFIERQSAPLAGLRESQVGCSAKLASDFLWLGNGLQVG